jgi:tRNA modification GTPase
MVGAQALVAGGVDTLLAILRDKATALAGLREAPVLTRARHREAVVEAARHLAAACCREEAELRGEEMRLALRALGRITGAVGVEEILDSVFGQFCIGK